jgi:hypothetical protein
MEINYGFVDENNVLLQTAVCFEGDFETIERVKSQFGATAYHPVGDVPIILNSSIWMGDHFTV